MATTTNYSWTTPDDTDLVKDGASAIRTLGSSADTTVKDLNPGTTAGDIDYYTSSTAKARVAIGTAGQVLQVNSGATAPEWATPASGSFTLLSTTTLTGTETSVTGISGAFENLYIEIENWFSTTNERDLRIRFNNDSGSVYSGVISTVNGLGVSPAITHTSDNFAIRSSDPGGTNSALSDQKNYSVITIYDYATSANKKMFQRFSQTRNSSNETGIGILTGSYGGNGATAPAAITSIQFIHGIGAASFGGGTVRIYGVK
jgi:hypothetical protein